jgi:hypothetical protein
VAEPPRAGHSRGAGSGGGRAARAGGGDRVRDLWRARSGDAVRRDRDPAGGARGRGAARARCAADARG